MAGGRVAAALRPAGGAGPATRLTLRPLPPDDVALLATAIADRPLPDEALAGIVPRSGGNPLFAELARRWPRAARRASCRTASSPWSRAGSTASTPRRAPAARRRCWAGGSTSTCCASCVDGDALDARDLARWSASTSSCRWEGRRSRASATTYVDAAYAGLSYRRRRALHAAPPRRSRPARLRAAGRPRRAGAALPARWAARRGLARGPAGGGGGAGAYASAEACDAFALALEAGRAAGVPAGELAEVAEALGDVGELAGRYPGPRTATARPRPCGATSRWPAPGCAQARRAGEREGRYPDALRWYGRALERDRRSRRRPGRRPRAGGARAGLRRGAVPPGPLPGVGALRASGSRPRPRPAGDELSLAHALFLLDNAYTDLGRPFRRASGPGGRVFERHGDDANLGRP